MRAFLIALLLLPALLVAQESNESQPVDPEPIADDEPAAETSSEADIDFKPSEEISEDFPVPLPSDI